MRKPLFFMLVLGLTCQQARADVKALVTSVSDGDTLIVQDASGSQYTVNLYGVDAPERGQLFSDTARRFTASLALREKIILPIQPPAEKEPVICDVILPDGGNLGERLIQEGWAWWDCDGCPDRPALGELQAIAKDRRKGVWRQENPTPPWEYRQANITPIPTITPTPIAGWYTEMMEEEWFPVATFGLYTTVYMHPTKLRDGEHIAEILRKIDNGKPVQFVWFFDSKKYAATGVPMTDQNMLHWRAKYQRIGYDEEFHYIYTTDPKASPPEQRFEESYILAPYYRSGDN